MSLIRINVIDRNTSLVGEVHGSEGNPLVATLTADPETIEEFETASRRFIEVESDWPVSRWFTRRNFEDPERFPDFLNLEPYDAGVLVIDLAARIIACDSTYAHYSREGTIGVRDRLSGSESENSEFGLPYRLSDEWLFIFSMEEYEGRARERRKQRLHEKPFDAREVLYGEALSGFIAGELTKSQIPENEHLRSHLHALWLSTPRNDLTNKTPRQVLLEKREHIDFDLHSRSLQYSFTKDCPPDLDTASAAYKYAGFGTHEFVVYYDLIRFLMESFHKRTIEKGTQKIENGIEFLELIKGQWLDSPNPEYSGRVPSDILESERRRRNLTMSPHECIIDEDCPICVEMSQIFDTPMFWHLDGCNMDDKFEFSFYESREEWLAEQAAFEAHMKREMQRMDFEDSEDAEEFIRQMNG